MPVSTCEVNFGDMTDLRSRISDDIRDARGATNPKRKVIRDLYKMQAALDNAIARVGEGTPLAENYKTFRQEYYTDFIQRFEQGTVYKIRGVDRTGAYRIHDEDVASYFSKDVTAARDYKRVFGNDPDALNSYGAVLLDDLAAASVVDGVVNRAKYNSWYRRNEAVLKEFPEIKALVDDIGARNEALLQRQKTLTGRKTVIEAHRLYKELRKIRTGDLDPKAMIERSLTNPVYARQIMKRLSPENRQAYKREVWMHMLAQDRVNVDPDILRGILGNEHYQNLAMIYRAREIVARVPRSAGRGDIPRPLQNVEEIMGMQIPTFSTRLWALQSRRVPKYFLLTDAAMRFIRGRSQAETVKLYEEALYNPQVARDFAMMLYTKNKKPVVARRLNTRLFVLGISSRTEEDKE
jgi:hypothetical protein